MPQFIRINLYRLVTPTSQNFFGILFHILSPFPILKIAHQKKKNPLRENLSPPITPSQKNNTHINPFLLSFVELSLSKSTFVSYNWTIKYKKMKIYYTLFFPISL